MPSESERRAFDVARAQTLSDVPDRRTILGTPASANYLISLEKCEAKSLLSFPY